MAKTAALLQKKSIFTSECVRGQYHWMYTLYHFSNKLHTLQEVRNKFFGIKNFCLYCSWLIVARCMWIVVQVNEETGNRRPVMLWIVVQVNEETGNRRPVMLWIVVQVNEETGNRRPVMLWIVVQVNEETGNRRPVMLWIVVQVNEETGNRRPVMLWIVVQVNEETGNRRPVMLSVLTRSEKEAQVEGAKDQPAAGAAASDTDAEVKPCVKGINNRLCVLALCALRNQRYPVIYFAIIIILSVCLNKFTSRFLQVLFKLAVWHVFTPKLTSLLSWMCYRNIFCCYRYESFL